MRFFNTAGPCMEQWHYMLPAAERLPEVPTLVERGMYFVVHAPRQTGKTTTLMALARQLTAGGKYAALHFSCEAGEVPEDDYIEAQRAVLTAIRVMARVACCARAAPTLVRVAGPRPAALRSCGRSGASPLSAGSSRRSPS